LFLPAQDYIDESPDIFQAYIDEAVDIVKNPDASVELNVVAQHLTIKYVMRALFDIEVTDPQLLTLNALFFEGGEGNFLGNAMQPFAQREDNEDVRANYEFFVNLVATTSPIVLAYEPSTESKNLTRYEYADLLFSSAGIAGFLGLGVLSTSILTVLPSDYPVDVNNSTDVLLTVLETARINPPVNNINFILQEARSFTIRGEEVEFPAGTIVAASIGLASVDPDRFPDPLTFDSTRPNLKQDMMNFNGIGFNPEGAGKRLCIGRNVAISMATDLLVALRS